MSTSSFFSQRVVNEWNVLPEEVVDATSVNQFKNSLDKYTDKDIGIKTWLNNPSADKYKCR